MSLQFIFGNSGAGKSHYLYGNGFGFKREKFCGMIT